MIESGMTFDYGQMLMDNEFAKMIKFVVGGIPVNDATMSVDLIKEVGPFKDFLAHDNTFDHMRMYPQAKLMDRRMRGAWEKSGSMDLYTASTMEARKILANHQPDSLPEDTIRKLRDIVKSAEEEMGIASEVTERTVGN